MWRGLLCTAARGDTAADDGGGADDDDALACSWRNPTVFFMYCAVDYSCYAWGLLVIRRGGANLMTLASAVALPLAQALFAQRWVMGRFTEAFRVTDGVALVCALVGFAVYERWGKPPRAAAAAADAARGDGAGARDDEPLHEGAATMCEPMLPSESAVSAS